MVTIRKALANDFDEVANLLLGFRNPYLTRDDYRNLFKRQWDAAEDWHGFVLVDGQIIVGFLGTIFSRRVIDGREHRLCNVNHWIVKPDYRRHSMKLFMAATGLKGYTFTSFTPTRTVAPIYEKLRWKDLDHRCYIVPCIPAAGSKWPLIFELAKIQSRLDPGELRLFLDHQPFSCRHVYIENGAAPGCYVVYTRVRRKRLPFVLIHYIGNPDVFFKAIPALRWKLCTREKAVGLLIDDRFMRGAQVFGAVPYDGERRFFRSDELTRFDIDSLYSEYIVVNL